VLTDATSVPIRTEADIVSARQTGRRMAAELGFSASQLTMIATAISELARNVVTYAGGGEVLLELRQNGSRRGILVVARDDGPGIADIEAALQDGFSTGNSLGLGLPGARRLMDEFSVVSAPGQGTTVTATKWAPA
jgi:serine/threonine-protein kinase RsbT